MPRGVIVNITYTKGYGGGEESLKDIILILNDTYKVCLLAPEGILTKRLQEKIPIIKSKGIGQLYRKSNKLWIVTLMRRYIISFFEVFRIINKWKPDIVHCFSEITLFYAALPAKLLGKKVVCNIHNVIPKNIFWEWLSLLLGMFVSSYIVVSLAVKKRLVEIGHDPQKIIVLYNKIDFENTINTEKVPFGVFREKFGLRYTDFIVGTIGAVYSLKGQHVFLEAINLMKQKNELTENSKFLVVGGSRCNDDKPYWDDLKAFISRNELADKVLLTDNIDQEVVPYALKDLDVFVFCSILPDAFPRVTIEAMAMKKVVIASNIGGVPEQIEDGVSGILYEPGNAEELARNIKFVIDNFQKMKSMSLKANEVVVKRFSPEVFQKNLLAIFNKITENRF